jgi:pSer/pThr/pTyr-binding forkhead associated (FHA) protein
MDYQLLIIQGRSGSKAIKLGDGVAVVGRQDDCQLRIKSAQVSRRHCELFEKKGLLLVKELGSSNGTFVNGKRVEGQRVLEPGDEIKIGKIKLRVAKLGEPVPPPKSKPAKKPGDTAIVDMVADESEGGVEEEFDIEFDAGPETPSPAAKATEQPEPAASPAATPVPTKTGKTPAREPDVAAEPGMADDAVADFLLGIKFDEE